MSGFDVDRVAHHVRRLDERELAALVADLWAARGYRTDREGVDVRAVADTETVRLRVGAGPMSGEQSPDVVVPVGGESANTHDGADVVDAGTLAEMLGYAIDRSVATDICRRHLGAPPGDLSPPPARRLRRRVDGTASSALLASALVTCALVVVLGGAIGGPAVLGSGEDTASDGDATTVAVETPRIENSSAADPAGAARDGRAGGKPPGVSESGIEDIDALAAAHERAVANRSHTVWIDWHRPRNLRADGTRVKRDIDVAAEGDRYLVRTSNEVAGNETRSGEIYHDGSGIYVAVWNETEQRHDRVFRITPRQNTVPTPESVRTELVTRYLSTPTTNLTGVVDSDRGRLYRVVGSGPPNASAAITITNYTVEALIDSRGFVREVTVRARVSHPDTTPTRTFRVKREITYGRVGTTTVEPPEWYLNHTADE